MRKSKLNSRRRALRFERFESRCVLSGVHPGDPVLAAEHEAVMELVNYEAVTHTAISSGEWDNAAIWDHGVPGNGANVLIKDDVDVLIDSILADSLRTVRADGTLRFSTDVNTELRVDTIVVAPSGTLEMGSDAQPVQHDVTAKIIIVDSGPIDSTWDPKQFSRGLISHGEVRMHGDETTPFVALAGNVTAGSTQFVLASVPVGWDVGERLVITGTSLGSTHDEAEIKSIKGNRVTLVEPLTYDHTAPAGQSIYVGNVSRNVVIQSENGAEQSHRGHVMFMHSPHVDVDYSGFYGLGRTDKRNPLNNVEFDAQGQPVPGTGKNQVGRYSVHFHRATGDEPASIHGSAVLDSPGWGIVNHSGNVSVEDNVVFDVVGAAFVTEAGDEIGDFTGNLAIYSRGSGESIVSRKNMQDFGHDGDGFWFQGGGVRVENNIASGHKHSGFVFFTQPLNQPGLGVTKFLAANLADPSIAGGETMIDVGSVPILSFAHNVTYASGDGFEVWVHLLNAEHKAQSILREFDGWNLESTGIFIPYSNRIVLKNVTLIGDRSQPNGTGIAGNDSTKNITYQNVNISGFVDGISIPSQGVNRVKGGSFDNVNNIVIQTATEFGRRVEISGKVTFGKTSTRNILLTSNFVLEDNDITQLFNPERNWLGTVTFNRKQVYYVEQGANFVPFKEATAPAWIPKELLDKTNQDIFNTYGLAIGGVIAPADAVSNERVRGLIGTPPGHKVALKQLSAVYTNNLQAYKLTFTRPNQSVQSENPIVLREGWNVLTRRISGVNRTFLVYGDITAPQFELTSDAVINPLDLERGLLVTGKIVDDTGTRKFIRVFEKLNELKLRQRDDGSKYVAVRFVITDRARNFVPISLKITVDPEAPRQIDKGFKDLEVRDVSDTLTELLGT